jgi:hypothetical protein
MKILSEGTSHLSFLSSIFFPQAKHTVSGSCWGFYTSLFSLRCFFLEPNTRLAQAVGDFTPPDKEEREQEGTKGKHERYKGTNRQSK